MENYKTDLRHRLTRQGWGYSDDFQKAVEVAMKAGMEAAMKASGKKGSTWHQKPRWEMEKEKRILAETKMKELENIKKVHRYIVAL